MDHLVFLYYIACYTIGFFGLVFAVFTAVLHRSAVDGRYALFMASLTVIVVMDSLFIYLVNAGAQGGMADLLRPYIEIGGVSLLIAALPRFTHSFCEVPAKKKLNVMFLILGAASFVLGALWVSGIGGYAWGFADFILMIAVILYSVVSGHIYEARWPSRGFTEPERERWDRIMRAATVLISAFIPLFVLIDFFPGILPFLTERMPRNFRTYPLFFLLWNLVYILRTLPTYRRRDQDAGEWRFELSPREREVASLLLEGLSYREIAEKLYVSLATVKTHVNRIYDKTGAGNKMELSRMIRAGTVENGPSPLP